jgi:hypothetical protein
MSWPDDESEGGANGEQPRRYERKSPHATVAPESHLGIDIVDNMEQSRASFFLCPLASYRT